MAETSNNSVARPMENVQRVTTPDIMKRYPITPVMTTLCIHCGKEVLANNLFYAVGHPYYGVLHRECAPFYAFPGHWPHKFPLAYYDSFST
jgi:hypothetical protein